jgi:chondroitin AC lyase
MVSELTPAEVSYTIKVLSRATWERWTGENLFWGLGINVNLGVVVSNGTTVQHCFDVMWAGLVVQPGGGDGIQVDGSFYQHGPLLQTASYGGAFTFTIVSFLPLVTGTSYDISPAASAVLSMFVLDGQQYSLRTMRDGSRRSSWDFLPMGRQITREAATLQVAH